ncbi:hypothetical protein [Pseudarthrobacter chlorophenolicus]|uniref:hypothetical protein n=1 Tax=Pseudarthrobacter chlorophenolicus TaxID=85085 RepID=UPI0005F29529|nr:hypothetical protein [Pseudarthrobacter chlorophenolicus]
MTRPRRPLLGILGLSGLIVLTGCVGQPAPAPTASSAAPTPSASGTPAPSTTATPTTAPTATTTASTPAAPTTSAAAPPSSAPAQPPVTEEPQPTGLPEQTGPLTVYYVAVGDNGMSGPLIGCGDSLVATTTGPVTFTDQVRPSVEALLANKSRDVGMSGLVNALYQSNLTYVAGELTGNTITIWLTGQFMLGGVCDTPRVTSQLEYTAMAASGAAAAEVFVNGRPIDEVLSLK